MIDANSQFFAILTNVGMAKQANADALGLPWKFTEMGVGDANNTDPIPSATQTHLINEWRRRPLNQVRIDPVNPAVIIAEQIIPADEGGHWIREIGLYDADGDLVAVANCAPSFKPVLSQGSGRTQVVRMNFIVSNSGNITLKIDPAVVLATREYVDNKILEELYKLDNKQSVRVATTANIALAGLQTIDAVALVAGDRVLVKNQTVAKDNGIYIAGAPAWVRAADADTNAEVTSALLVSVEQGATLADTRWQLITDGVIVLGTTALTFQNVTQGFAPINSPALLGNPTAPTPGLFSNDGSLATTQYVQRALGSYAGQTNYAGNTILTAADVGKLSIFTAAATVTLPEWATVPPGGILAIVSGGGSPVTVQAKAGESLGTQSGQNGPFTIPSATFAVFRRLLQAPGWSLDSGDASLKYSPMMSGAHWVTQPQFSNNKALATTEFVQRALGSFSGQTNYTGDTVLTAVNVGQLTVMDGVSTVTLPEASTVPPGSLITLVGNNTYTVKAKAGETLASSNNQSGPFTFLTSAFSVFRRLIGGGGWTLDGGDGALKYSPLFTATLAANGYQKLPSGLIIQWGTATVTTDGSGNATVTHPIAFPTAGLAFLPIRTQASYASAVSWTINAYSPGTATTAVGVLNSTNSAAVLSTSVSFRWIAIGY